MKKAIKSILIILVCMISLNVQANNRKPKAHIEGKFINHSDVTYTLYKQVKGGYEEILTDNSKKSFWVNCVVGQRYLLVFTDKTGKTKYMSFIAHDAINIVIDVDFSSNKSIDLVYDGKDVTISEELGKRYL